MMKATTITMMKATMEASSRQRSWLDYAHPPAGFYQRGGVWGRFGWEGLVEMGLGLVSWIRVKRAQIGWEWSSVGMGSNVDILASGSGWWWWELAERALYLIDIRSKRERTEMGANYHNQVGIICSHINLMSWSYECHSYSFLDKVTNFFFFSMDSADRKKQEANKGGETDIEDMDDGSNEQQI